MNKFEIDPNYHLMSRVELVCCFDCSKIICNSHDVHESSLVAVHRIFCSAHRVRRARKALKKALKKARVKKCF